MLVLRARGGRYIMPTQNGKLKHRSSCVFMRRLGQNPCPSNCVAAFALGHTVRQLHCNHSAETLPAGAGASIIVFDAIIVFAASNKHKSPSCIFWKVAKLAPIHTCFRTSLFGAPPH